jgi:hypothetical protein
MTSEENPAPAGSVRAVGGTGLTGQPARRRRQPNLLLRYAARTLDPGTAVRFQNQKLESTVYTGGQLLVRPSTAESSILDSLNKAADQLDLDIAVNQVDQRLRAMASAAGIAPEDPQPLLLRVDLVPRWNHGPVSPPDAWPVLQFYRSMFKPGDPMRSAVQLNHLITSHSMTADPYWHPFAVANPYWHPFGSPGAGDDSAATFEYGVPGFGGRTPVSWVGPEPVRRPDEALGRRRRPVVAVLDTGVGEHPWLPDSIVNRQPHCGELSIGLTDAHTAPEDPSVASNPLIRGLDNTAGHGTFIAGLIRQKCPDANLLAIRVIRGDGTVDEADLLEALDMLWLRQKLAILHQEPGQLIDIVSLSLGYYHEEYGDKAFDPFLLAPLQALARLGVAVIVSAGNDATTRPMYPAAFAPYSGGLVRSATAGALPIVSVGANNPDGSIALFSNEGPWVRLHRPGAALVSTMPGFDSSRTPSTELRSRKGVRSSIDPDDFTSGFGLWSGTSFSSPIFAGEVAQFLNAQQLLDSSEVDPLAALDRGWTALSALVPGLERPAEPADRDDHHRAAEQLSAGLQA